MLEPLGSPHHWQWSVTGKHPAFKDYFERGHPLPLMKTFFGWLRKGYAMVASRRRDGGNDHFWRFWSRGIDKGFLVCGLIRDSGDGLGRPYPLLVIGQGPLEGWEDHWDLVPLACQKTWSEMDDFSRVSFRDLGELERTLSGVPSPEPAWERLGEERDRLGRCDFPDSGSPGSDGAVKRILAEDTGRDFFFIPLNQIPADDIFRSALTCHVAVGEHLQSPPNAVFMGGTPDKGYLVIYRRALSAGDFVRLWST
jgi:type VI secretion system protein VasJ